MRELLITARPARRMAKAAAAGAARGDRTNYATLENAGKPHKGRITEAERQLVSEHFDEVNERLAGQGIRAVSLADPDHVERYGLAELARSRAVDPD
jgi:hypothetical protein